MIPGDEATQSVKEQQGRKRGDKMDMQNAAPAGAMAGLAADKSCRVGKKALVEVQLRPDGVGDGAASQAAPIFFDSSQHSTMKSSRCADWHSCT